MSGMKDPMPQLMDDEDAIAVSGGTRHFSLLTDKGRVYAWGQNYRNQCNVPNSLKQEGGGGHRHHQRLPELRLQGRKICGQLGTEGLYHGHR